MSMHERLRQELRTAGYSTTLSRVLVCDELHRNEPLFMKDLVAKLQGRVDRATIYRIVNLFEQLGIIRRIPLGWKYKLELSDKFTDHHHHAHCQICKKIVILPEDNSLESAIGKTAKKAGFAVDEHHLEMRGVCADCAESAVAQ